MRISILCPDHTHPVNKWIERWIGRQSSEHRVSLIRDRKDLPGGDLLFLISCTQMVNAATRKRYQCVFVLHASDLPKGRGWSPHIWELLDGADYITLSLLDAEDSVDSGAVWAKRKLCVPKTALYDEINAILFSAELSLIDEAIAMVANGASPTQQSVDVQPTYYPKRSPKDSEIDPSQPLSQTFNKIRLMDPDRYPAFFTLAGRTYTIHLKQVSRDDNSID